MVRMSVQCVFLLLAYAFGFLHSGTLEDTQRLYDHFFNSSKYKDVRPILNQSEPIQVFISHYVTALEHIDIYRGVIETRGYILLSWKDELLQWDPLLFGNIEKAYMTRGLHWKPDIMLYGSVEDNQDFRKDDSDFAFIYSNGQALLFLTTNLKTRCQMDTSLFPFDSHSCTFEFYSIKHLADELILQSPSEYVIKFNFVENFEWDVIENSSRIIMAGDSSSNFTSTKCENRLVIKRRSTFIILHQFLPSFLLVCLNLFTCLVPLDSGERLSYSVTIFLAFVFLMNTVIEAIPVNSMSISISSYTFVFVNVTNSLTVVLSVLFVRMTRIDASKVNIPAILKKLVLWKRKSANRISSETNVNMTKACDNSPTKSRCKVQDFETAVENNYPGENASSENSKEGAKTEPSVSWSDVANVLDELYFKTLLTTIVVLYIVLVVFLWTKSAF